MATVVFGRMIYQKLKARRLKKKERLDAERAEQKKSRRMMRKTKKQQSENAELNVGLLDNETVEHDVHSDISMNTVDMNREETGEKVQFGKTIDSDGESDSDSDSGSDEEDWTSGVWRKRPSFIHYDRESSVSLRDESINADTHQHEHHEHQHHQEEESEEEQDRQLDKSKSFFYGPKMGMVQKSKDESLVIKEYFDEGGEGMMNDNSQVRVDTSFYSN